MKDEDRLYVVVRKDMGKSHRTVQVIHAAINLLARHHGISQNWDDIGPALVVYGATRAQLGRLEEILPASRLGELSELGEEELQRGAEELTAFERSISAQRRAVFDVLDRLQDEIIRRYRTGEATVDSLLP
jgi:hypothetical protein